MSIFHQHSWQEKERFYKSPVSENFTAENISQETIEKLLLGMTTILYICTICNKVKTVEILGVKQ